MLISFTLFASRRIDRLRLPFVGICRTPPHDASGSIDKHGAVVPDLVGSRARCVKWPGVSIFAAGRRLGRELKLQRARYSENLRSVADIPLL